MKLTDFKYTLPGTAIAKHPVSPRDSSKLMVLNRADQSVETNNSPILLTICHAATFLLLTKQKLCKHAFMEKKKELMQ